MIPISVHKLDRYNGAGNKTKDGNWVKFSDLCRMAGLKLKYRKCKFCETHMLIGRRLGGRSQQTKYCSNKCNQRAKRARARKERQR